MPLIQILEHILIFMVEQKVFCADPWLLVNQFA